MAKLIGGVLAATLALVLATGAAHAAGGTYDPVTGIVTVTNTGGAGASYELTSTVPAMNGDVLSFQWSSTDVTCGGGVPRVFIQGGAYNTFDADPAGPGACGTGPDGDGWYTVTGVVSGIVDGVAGHVGLVNDNPSDLGTIRFRNVTLDGVSLLPPMTPDDPTSMEECKHGGWRLGDWRNQGECVSHFARGGS